MNFPTDPTILNALLADAASQYHKLVTGTAAVEVVDQNGDKVTFARADQTKLYNYIAQLQGALNPATSACARGPLQFFF